MNRGGPLVRRTPLRRTPMSRKRPRARRRTAAEVGHGMPWTAVRMVLWVRCGGRCEGCGTPVTLASMEGHHRLTRRHGVDCPCNALALCAACHHGRVHGAPAAARELGQIVSRHDSRPAGVVPVFVHGRGWVVLACDGTCMAVPSDTG